MTGSHPPEIYAIDFGTTNSLLAAASPADVYRALPVDPAAPDPSVFRSILHFDESGSCAYGAQALERYQASGLTGRLVRSLKRYLPSREFISTKVAGRSYRLEQLIGGILRVLRERANRHFGRDVTRVVLGRPARFSDDAEDDRFAEERLLAAARLAGFTHIKLCAEPLAAAYDFQEFLAESRLVLIADLGGGTSDFSLIRMDRNGYRPEDVLATGGVSIAGDALDGALMRSHLAHHFGARARYRAPFGKNELTMPLSLVHKLYSPVDMSLLSKQDVLEFLRRVKDFSVSPRDRASVERLLIVAEDALGFHVYEAIEALKRALSQVSDGQVEFCFDYPGVDVTEPISLADFSAATRGERESIFRELAATLERARVEPDQIEVVCCTGGTSRVSLIASELKSVFPRATHHSLSSFRAVVDGLARLARRDLLAS